MILWRILTHNFYWKLAAVVLAVLLWILVVGTRP
jgi:hypothetical protein